MIHQTRGSLLLTILLHDSTKTIIGTVLLTQRGYLSLYLTYEIVALLVIGATRGQLAYQRDGASS